jgi:hypothetical protein
VDYSPRGGRCDSEIPSAVFCDSLTRRSRPTLLSGSVDQRSRLAIGREAPHALKLDRSTPEGYEVEIARQVPDTTGSRIQPGAPRCDARSDRYCGEAFSPLAQPHSQLDKVLRRSQLVSTTASSLIPSHSQLELSAAPEPRAMTVAPISFSVAFCGNFLIDSVVLSAGQGLAARLVH